MRATALERTDPDTAAAFAEARHICRRHAGSLYFATAFLAPAKRDAACAAYAFCRLIADAMNGGEPAETSPGGSSCEPSGLLDHKLSLLRDRLDEIYDGRLELPRLEFRTSEQHVLYAFARTVARSQIPKECFLDLANGHRMGLTVSRYATWSSLEKYCYHAGGAGGVILGCVLGLTHSDANRQAVQMGNAIQLTCILRDLKEDTDRGRFRLPLEDLARFRYSERDLAAGVVNDNFRELMRFEIARARDLYRDGADGICWLAGDGAKMTAASIAISFSGILRAIERRGYDVFSRPVQLGAGQTLRRLPAAWRLARRSASEPLPRVFD